MPEMTFYFDVGSPYVYLAAERLDTVVREPVEWQPVLVGGLFKLAGRSSWALGDERESGMAEVERRARAYGLPPLRWPDPWPSDYLAAMRAVTFAHGAGCGRDFTMAALRNAFQRGRDLSRTSEVIEVGREVGLGAGELERAIDDRAIKQGLRDATDAAFARGVFGVPTFAVGDELFWGDDRLDEAAACLRAA